MKKNESRLLYVILAIAAVIFGWFLFPLFTQEPEVQPQIVHKIVSIEECPSIKLTQIGRLYLIESKINGQKGFFLVDTGAETSIINDDFTDTLQIHYLDSAVIPHPESRIKMTDTVNVKFDTLIHVNSVFYSYSLKTMSTELNKIDTTRSIRLFGLLGQDVLKEKSAILNYQNDRIYIVK